MDINTIAKGLLTMSTFQAIDNHPNVESLLFKDDGYRGSTLIRPALEQLRDAVALGEIDRL